MSQSAYAVAKITYPDKSEGHLVYLTTALIKGLRLQLMGYKGLNWDFPDQSTGDQFFSETQFEAYRELGFAIAESAKRLLGSHSAVVTRVIDGAAAARFNAYFAAILADFRRVLL